MSEIENVHAERALKQAQGIYSFTADKIKQLFAEKERNIRKRESECQT